jgi:hypothetical protein
VGALADERQALADLRQAHAERLREFEEFRRREGWDVEAFEELVAQRDEGLRGRRAEAARAAALAFAVDFKRCATFAGAEAAFLATVREVAQGSHARPRALRAWRATARCFRRQDPRGEALERLRARQPDLLAGVGDSPDAAWDFAYEAVSLNLGGASALLALLTDGETLAAGSGQARARKILLDVIADVDGWTTQLVILRMLQTLTILDLKYWRGIVQRAGNYDERRPASATAGRPRA